MTLRQGLALGKSVESSGTYHDSQYHNDILSLLPPSKSQKENHVALTGWSEADLFFEEKYFIIRKEAWVELREGKT